MAKKAPQKQRLKSKTKKTKRAPWPRVMRFVLFGIIGAIGLLFLLFGAIYIGLFGKLPDADDIKGIRTNNASEVYGSDGVLLGKYFVQNRSSVAYTELPQVIIDALIATEDSRFFEHEGIDFYSIPRVVVKTIILGDQSGGGGSTISQQLVKNLFGRENYSALSMPVNKLKENITALKIEEVYNKEEIITLYLNTVSFGENVFGIKAASQRFFSKNPAQLSVIQAATLVGMLKANTSYNPRLHPEASKRRRNTVLALMAKEGSIEVDELNRLLEMPLELDYQRMEGQFGPAPYLRAHIEPELKEILGKLTKENGNPYNLYADGLRIKLGIDSRMQKYAEESVKNQMKKLQLEFDKHWKSSKPWGKDDTFIWAEAKKSIRYQRQLKAGATENDIRANFNTKIKLLRYTPDGLEVAEMSPLDSVAYHQMILQTGFVAIASETGRVLAYVGGTDFGHFPYDHVQGKRQVGSTFKPFVYTAALEAGKKPCDYIDNESLIFSNYDDWSPENSGGKSGGYYSLRGGLANSVNLVAARLIAETGFDAVIDVARRAGITAKLPRVPAIALGVADLSLLELVRSYAVFGNGGKSIPTWFIDRIETSEGKLIYESKSAKPRQVLDPEISRTMLSMLETVVDSGTARSVRTRYGVQTDLAGKTGTTQNNADGWFVAIAPKLVCGAWVGGQSPKVRFRSTALGQGAATALPIVANWMRAVEKNVNTAKIAGKRFPTPSIEIILSSECPMYMESRTEIFLDDLFNRDTRTRRKELEQERDSTSVKPQNSEKEDRWMKRLLDKLKTREEN